MQDECDFLKFNDCKRENIETVAEKRSSTPGELFTVDARSADESAVMVTLFRKIVVE